MEAFRQVFSEALVVEQAGRLVALDERIDVRFERCVARLLSNEQDQVLAQLAGRAIEAIEVAKRRVFEAYSSGTGQSFGG